MREGIRIMTNGKILMIDDEIRICELMEVFLCKRGYDVRSACTGTEAIELTKKDEFDLVLCDYIMPKISGYDVATVLNQLEKKPKIGIMSGSGKKLKPPEDEELKVDFIIKKPFDFSELTKLIDDALVAK